MLITNTRQHTEKGIYAKYYSCCIFFMLYINRYKNVNNSAFVNFELSLSMNMFVMFH